MKARHIHTGQAAAVALTALFALLIMAPARAATTINAASHYAYGANLGWMDWRGDVANGVVINDYYCSGYIYAANLGWISLGDGSPANSIRYQNASASDFGVNNDGLGNLRGYAWAPNIGWLNFENQGAPRVDLVTGNFSGYVWSANCGWISLSNVVAQVQTDHILPGPLAANGLPIPWLMEHFGTTAVDPDGDPDHDGMTTAQEQQAGTDPRNGNDRFYITSIGRGFLGDPNYVALWWTSKPTRLYRLYYRTGLESPPPWAQFVTGFEDWLGWNNVGFNDYAEPRFYRVEVVRPLP